MIDINRAVEIFNTKPVLDNLIMNQRNPFKELWHKFSEGEITGTQLRMTIKRHIIRHLERYQPRPIDLNSSSDRLAHLLIEQESSIFWLEKCEGLWDNEEEKKKYFGTVSAFKKNIIEIRNQLAKNAKDQPKKKKKV